MSKDFNRTSHQFRGKMRNFYVEFSLKEGLPIEFKEENITKLLDIIQDSLTADDWNLMKKYSAFSVDSELIQYVTEKDLENIDRISETVKEKQRFVSIEKKGDSLTSQLESLGENLFVLLSKKYSIHMGVYSPSNLSNLTHKLRRANRITHIEANQIFNLFRMLNKIEEIEVTTEDVKSLTKLYEQLKKHDVNRLLEDSELEKILKKLSMQSRDMIVHADNFESFNEYMHVERPIQKDLELVIEDFLLPRSKSLIFLVGNVGDGKSHLLAYMNQKYQSSFQSNEVVIHNDATESDAPNKTAIEHLVEILDKFKDSNIRNMDTSRLIIAINLGVLTNLKRYLQERGDFQELTSYIDSSGVLEGTLQDNQGSSYFKIVSFLDRKELFFKNGEIINTFYQEIFNRIFSKTEENIFYQAYLNDIQSGMEKLIHENYRFLLNHNISNSVLHLLNRVEVEFKEIISTRSLMNFIYDIVSPKEDKNNSESYLPHLIFKNKHKSTILTRMHSLDPVNYQTSELNELAIDLYHSNDILEKVKDLLSDSQVDYIPIFSSFKDFTTEEDFKKILNTFIRVKFLDNPNDSIFGESMYHDYLKQLSLIDSQSSNYEISELVMYCLELWNGRLGDLHEGYLLKSRGNEAIKVAVKVNIDDSEEMVTGSDIIVRFFNSDQPFDVTLDFSIYELLRKIETGYFIKENDRNIAIQFDSFVDEIINSSKSMQSNLIVNMKTNDIYELKKSFGKVKLQKGG